MKLKPITKAKALPTRLERVISEHFNYSRNGTHRSLWVPFFMLSCIKTYVGESDEEKLPPIHDIIDHTGTLFGYMVSLPTETPNDFIFFIPRCEKEEKLDARFKVKALANSLDLVDDAYSFSIVFVNMNTTKSTFDKTYDSCYITGFRQFIPIISIGTLPIVAKYNLTKTFGVCDPETIFSSFFKFVQLNGFWNHFTESGTLATSGLSIDLVEILLPSSVLEPICSEESANTIKTMLHISSIKTTVSCNLFSDKISFVSINSHGEAKNVTEQYIPLIWKD